MKSSRLILTFVLLSLTVACGSNSSPEILSITTRVESSGTVDHGLVRFHYLEPGQLDYAEHLANGRVGNKTDYFYNADFTIRKVEFRSYYDDDFRLASIEMKYNESGLPEWMYSQALGGAVNVDYTDDVPSYIRYPSGQVNAVTLDYDDDLALESLRGGAVTIDIRRGEHGPSVVERRGTDNYDLTNYRYEDGRLSGVVSDSERWDLDYDDEGRISRITRLSFESARRVITDYEYGDGEMRGIQPTPALPNSFLFGMDGRPLDTVHLLTLDFWLFD